MDPDALFPTLFGKTFFVLALQLFITWLTTQVTFAILRHRGPDDPPPENVPTHVDLEECNPRYIKQLLNPWLFRGVFAADIVVFLLLLFWGSHQSLAVSMTLFSIWSVLTGFQIEAVLLAVDHGLGQRALALTALIVLVTCLIGLYSRVDFGFLQLPLFIGLLALIGGGIYRTLRGMQTATQRTMAMCGTLLFTLYLVLDFNRLQHKQEAGVNSWHVATDMAISIYLDIINLLLELIDLLDKLSHS